MNVRLTILAGHGLVDCLLLMCPELGQLEHLPEFLLHLLCPRMLHIDLDRPRALDQLSLLRGYLGPLC